MLSGIVRSRQYIEQLAGVHDPDRLVWRSEMLPVPGDDVVRLCCVGTFVNPVVCFVAGDLQRCDGRDLGAHFLQEFYHRVDV